MPNSAWDKALEINLTLRFPWEPHMGFLSKLEVPGRERQREMVRGLWVGSSCPFSIRPSARTDPEQGRGARAGAIPFT